MAGKSTLNKEPGITESFLVLQLYRRVPRLAGQARYVGTIMIDDLQPGARGRLKAWPSVQVR